MTVLRNEFKTFNEFLSTTSAASIGVIIASQSGARKGNKTSLFYLYTAYACPKSSFSFFLPWDLKIEKILDPPASLSLDVWNPSKDHPNGIEVLRGIVWPKKGMTTVFLRKQLRIILIRRSSGRTTKQIFFMIRPSRRKRESSWIWP